MRVDAAAAAASELGAALHSAPFSGLTASAYALSSIADSSATEDLLSAVLTGERICGFGKLDSTTGTARLIDGAADADSLVLLDSSKAEIVVLIDRSDWRADPRQHSFDVSRTCADISIDEGTGLRFPHPGGAPELYRLLLSADAVGGVQHMLDRTVAYTGQRAAFGRAIGGFQAVQHRLVDHTLRARGMALLVAEAARLLAAGSPEAPRFVAMAELSVSSGAAHILHDLLQLTGAIGFTWEYGLHYYERRVHQDARLAANPRAAVRSLARLEGWTGGH
jgi:Acyl-CoA dehydrogenase, C-terminal domain